MRNVPFHLHHVIQDQVGQHHQPILAHPCHASQLLLQIPLLYSACKASQEPYNFHQVNQNDVGKHHQPVICTPLPSKATVNKMFLQSGYTAFSLSVLLRFQCIVSGRPLDLNVTHASATTGRLYRFMTDVRLVNVYTSRSYTTHGSIYSCQAAIGFEMQCNATTHYASDARLES